MKISKENTVTAILVLVFILMLGFTIYSSAVPNTSVSRYHTYRINIRDDIPCDTITVTIPNFWPASRLVNTSETYYSFELTIKPEVAFVEYWGKNNQGSYDLIKRELVTVEG